MSTSHCMSTASGAAAVTYRAFLPSDRQRGRAPRRCQPASRRAAAVAAFLERHGLPGLVDIHAFHAGPGARQGGTSSSRWGQPSTRATCAGRSPTNSMRPIGSPFCARSVCGGSRPCSIPTSRTWRPAGLTPGHPSSFDRGLRARLPSMRIGGCTGIRAGRRECGCGSVVVGARPGRGLPRSG